MLSSFTMLTGNTSAKIGGTTALLTAAVGRLDRLGEAGIVDQRLELVIILEEIRVLGCPGHSIPKHQGSPSQQANAGRSREEAVQRTKDQLGFALRHSWSREARCRTKR